MGNRKLTVPFVGLFLLLVLDWNTLVLVSGDLPLLMRWRLKASKEKKQLPVAVRGPRTSVLKLPTTWDRPWDRQTLPSLAYPSANTRGNLDEFKATYVNRCPNTTHSGKLKAVSHKTTFRLTCLEIFLRHKLHEKLPSVTYPATDISRLFFVAAIIAKSRTRFYVA